MTFTEVFEALLGSIIPLLIQLVLSLLTGTTV